MRIQLHALSVSVVLAGVFLLAGCNKKVAKITPPPPPAAVAPTVTLAANPAVIQKGEETTITWQTVHADDITIPGLGTVPSSGSRRVKPDESITYTLVAKGPGGAQDASARVTVNPAPPTQSLLPAPSEQDLFGKSVRDLYFNYDQYDIRGDEALVTATDAKFLEQHPDIKVTVEGHCDDRGSEEYNLVLGDSRANSLKKALQQQGVSEDRIKTVSYGKEKPFCSEDNEQCWQENRRDHMVYQR